jgi:hypothetical protein
MGCGNSVGGNLVGVTRNTSTSTHEYEILKYVAVH